MYQAKSGKRRFVDKHVGRITRSGRKRHLGGSGTCKGASHQKRKRNMSQFEKFVAEGNEKADELAKAGAMLNKGFMAEAKAETLQQEERRGACSTAACGQLPLPGRTKEGL